ncbi:MAG: PilC/PilY family type IV pilus protein [Pseudomonadota bacterium]
MTQRPLLKNIGYLLISFLFTAQVQAGLTDLANIPISTATPVLPNVMLMMDDSGSMAWDYMPDNGGSPYFAIGTYGYVSSQCNGVYYNPRFTYLPPVTSAGVSYATSSFTAAKIDGFGTTTASTIDLSAHFLPGQYTDSSPTTSGGSAAYYYTYSGSQPALTTYTNSSSTFFTECNTSASASSPTTATITVSGSSSTTVSSIKVNGNEILGSTTSSSATSSTVASNIASTINSCPTGGWGASCTAGYSATSSGSVVTITGPAGITYTPTISKSGSMAFTATAFSTSPPKFTKVIVSSTSGDTAHGMPADERTNFANWYSYYRTRMLMMKSSTGLAFQTLGSQYQVGFATINNNGGSQFVNPSAFDSTQKSAWYTKMYGSTAANSTPLREALAKVGLLYAHKLPGNTLNTVAASDPLQYSCQKNFTLLSTDGYWNGNAGYKVDGSTAVGNQDGADPEGRPYNDGTAVTYTKSTSQLNQTQTTIIMSTSQLQSDTIQLTKTITQLQKSTSTLQKQTGQLQIRTGSTGWGGTSWGAWSNTASCTWSDGTGGGGWGGGGGTTPTQCQYVWGSWSSAASCTTSYSSATANGTTWSGNGTNCQYTAWSAGVGTNSCTAVAQSASPNYTAATAVQCNTVTTSPTASVASCTPVSIDSSGYTTTCADVETRKGVSSCTPTIPAGTRDGTGKIVTCQTVTTGPSGASSCTAGTDAEFKTTTCSSSVSTTPVASCTPVTGSNSNGGVTTTCNTVTTGPATVSACIPQSATSPDYLAITCSAPITNGGTSNTLADVAEYYYVTDLRTSALGNCVGSTGNTLCSASDTISDKNSYNNVPKNDNYDTANWQHMTTFAIGLGAPGNMIYPGINYRSLTAGDFFSVWGGQPMPNQLTTVANAATGVCTWQADGTICNWPVPAADSPSAIDDLWHAAVNGRGTFYNAPDPNVLSSSLADALGRMGGGNGSQAGAAVSSPILASSGNFVFSSQYTPIVWTGDVLRVQLNAAGQVKTQTDAITGVTSPITDWSAASLLNQRTASSTDSRNIYIYKSSTSNKLTPFTYANLTPAQQAFFNTTAISTTPPSGSTGLSQLLCTVAAVCLTDKSAAAGSALVDFLRGQRGNEGALYDNTKSYRQRSGVLGDIVNATVLYVQGSPYNYSDTGYGAFKTTNVARYGMVYAGGNDGMLHAFYATTGNIDATGASVAGGGTAVTGGDEAWAYIPSMVLPKLYTLADKNYSSKHQFFVDGPPVQGDVYFSGAWHTILVGGLNAGGRGYYALDITNPSSPKALWEFSSADNANMGYSFGNPKITKITVDGAVKWVVLVTSGYNNYDASVGGDGVGRLFMLNAGDGTLVTGANTSGIISTGVGDTTTPSGLARISAMTSAGSIDNTTLQVYGGDLLGNLWRFDVNDNVGSPATHYEAQLLATLKDGSGNRQPITTKPEIGMINSNVMVFVGTGKYLGATDLTTTAQQSFYGIMDPLASGSVAATAIYPNPRANAAFVNQTELTSSCAQTSSVCTSGNSVRTSSNNSVSIPTNNVGWYIDLPESGERANTDPILALGTLAFTTNVPNVNSCTPGHSWRYFLNFQTGAAVATSDTTGNTVVAERVDGSNLSSGVTMVQKDNGSMVAVTVASDGTVKTFNSATGGSSALPTKRTSWRELITE